MSKAKEVSTCIQCQGDEMLEVRRHAGEAFEVMNRICIEYGAPKKQGVSIVDFVAALIEAEHDQRRLCAARKHDAERRLKEVRELIAALRFVSDATKETYSSGVNVGGKAMTLQFSEIFRVAIHRLESLVSADKGLLEGKQPQNDKDFLSHLIERKGGDT